MDHRRSAGTMGYRSTSCTMSLGSGIVLNTSGASASYSVQSRRSGILQRIETSA
jgi:hypothetical protein